MGSPRNQREENLTFRIYNYLKENTSKKKPVSIKDIEKALYGEKEYSEKRSKNNIRQSHYRTIQKHLDLIQNQYEDSIFIIPSEDDRASNTRIYFEQPITDETLYTLVEYTLSIPTDYKQKQTLLNQLFACAGNGMSEKYKTYLKTASPAYTAMQKALSPDTKLRYNRGFKSGKEEGKLAAPCNFVDITANMKAIFNALIPDDGKKCKISFHLVNYTSGGEKKLVKDSLYIVSPYCVNVSDGRLWLVANHEPYDNLSIYPIDLMTDIGKLEKPIKSIEKLDLNSIWPTTEKKEEKKPPCWSSLKKDEASVYDGKILTYAAESQGGSYGAIQPIILHVKHTSTAYTLIYRTFDNDFYRLPPLLNTNKPDYDRILVFRTPYFIMNWAMTNLRDVTVETSYVRKEIEKELQLLNAEYPEDELKLLNDEYLE